MKHRLAVILCALSLGCGTSAPTVDAGSDAGVGDAASDDASSSLDARIPDAGADAGPPPPSRAAARPYRQWVDPFIGTGGMGFATGSAFPGPAMPFGLARPGPDTTDEFGARPAFYHFSGYYQPDEYVRSFSQLRMHGTGIADYGVIGVMPGIGPFDSRSLQPDLYQQHMMKSTERASPGAYSVTFESGISVALTASARVAHHRHTFPASAGVNAGVLVDLGYSISDVTITEAHLDVLAASREVTGWVGFRGGYSGRFGGMKAYFVLRASRPFTHAVWQGSTLEESGTTRDGTQIGALLRFDATTDRSVDLAIGLSFTDVAHARQNLEAELTDFDTARTRAETEWEAQLSRIELEGRSERDFRIFYTSLYHALMMPTLVSDTDGAYRGIDGNVHQATGYQYHSDFSLWDTYRTLHPFLTLVYPEKQRDLLLSLLAMGRDRGFMPRWPLGTGETDGMLGDGGTIVFADSYVKGLRDFDLREAYGVLKRNAMDSAADRRPDLATWSSLRYYPHPDIGSSVSWTLESAYADHTLAQLADALGETADRDALRARAGYWRNTYDPAQGFMVGRARGGAFDVVGADTTSWKDYFAEGNVWQYTWFVPHDIEGMAAHMGGADQVMTRLDELFTRTARTRRTLVADPYYWHGNEPDLHYAYIFSALGDANRSAKWSRWIMANRYSDTPDGLPGNDDCGTMSAWYMFAAMGFYPIAGTDLYLIGSPLVTRAVVHRPGGDLIIEAPDASDAQPYPTRVQLGAAALAQPRFVHAQIAAGGTLRFTTQATPGAWLAQ